MPQAQTTATTPVKKTWKDWLTDITSVATGEKSPTIGATIDNVPEIRNNLLIAGACLIGGFFLLKLIYWAITKP